MITIAFYSYKGGVGRSLALANLGVYLSQFGATVAMVDFDLEAPGLHYKFSPGSAPIEVRNGGVAPRILAEVSRGNGPDDVDYDLAIDITSRVIPDAESGDAEQTSGRLLLVPAGDPLDPEYWRDCADIDWVGLFTGRSRPGVRALAQLKTRLANLYAPDILLVDSRTGISASGGVATTLLPDVVVALLLNTPEHIDGSRVVISAIVNSGGADGPPPRVVPVLSRYPTPQEDFESAREVRPRSRTQQFEEGEIPLDDVAAALKIGLPSDAAERVDNPFVLHSDPALQRREELSFGPSARNLGQSATSGLLDDYVRLFASLVPPEVVTRHLSGVRNKVRSIILDQPDDAVRTLENLAALVDDVDVFIDLIKVHQLRRDPRSLLSAAERLYRVHRRVVVDPSISRAVSQTLGFGGRRPLRDVTLDPAFAEAYWRKAAPNDLTFAAGVACLFASAGNHKHAEELAEQAVAASEDSDVLRMLVETLAEGDPISEKLAVRLAVRHFSSGEQSPEFLRAAVRACGYQDDAELARMIIDSPGFGGLPAQASIRVLIIAGRTDEAGRLLVQTLADLEPLDAEVRVLADSWFSVSSRNRALRSELQDVNPAMYQHLEARRESEE